MQPAGLRPAHQPHPLSAVRASRRSLRALWSIPWVTTRQQRTRTNQEVGAALARSTNMQHHGP
eukprot:11807855-Alexandrium_andersonii.AAC.1